MNYTPLKLPLKQQEDVPAGLVPMIAFSVLLLIAAIITGALVFSKSSAYSSKKPEELQNYTIAHSTNIAATVAARAALGAHAPSITDTPHMASDTDKGQVAGASTSTAPNQFTPNDTVIFDKCFNSTAVNPEKDLKEVSSRCPLYLPKGKTRENLAIMEDGNSLSLLDGGAVILNLKKSAPEGQTAPVCVTVHDYLSGGANPVTKQDCSMTKVSANTKHVTIDGLTAASSIVESMRCENEKEESCTVSSTHITIPIDGGLYAMLPLISAQSVQDVELQRVK